MTYVCEERLYLTADGKLVEEGDLKAVSLATTPGLEISDEEADKLGLKDRPAVKAQPKAPENKQVAGPPQNKAVDNTLTSAKASGKPS